MIFQGLIGLFTYLNNSFSQPKKLLSPAWGDFVVRREIVLNQQNILANRQLDLSNRDKNEFVSQVYKDNILLALDYLGFGFTLKPGEVFAFHENVLPKYKSKAVKTMKSRFIASEGYRSSGWVFGDGVCHLASLLSWTAFDARLEVKSNVKHSFRSISGIPEKHQISIRYSQSGSNSQNQNLYITNNLDFPVEFRFSVIGDKLKLKIIKK